MKQPDNESPAPEGSRRFVVPKPGKLHQAKSWVVRKWRKLCVFAAVCVGAVVAVAAPLGKIGPAIKVAHDVWKYFKPATVSKLVAPPGSVDLNALERKYPDGFQLFKYDKWANRWETADYNGPYIEIIWDAFEFERVGTEQLRVLVPFRRFQPKSGTTLEDINVEHLVPNRVDHRDPFLVWPSPAGECDALWFEILDNHPRHPIFVMGVGPSSCNPETPGARFLVPKGSK